MNHRWRFGVYEKLFALRRLCEFASFLPAAPKNRTLISDDLILMALHTIIDHMSEPYQKAAAALILDCVSDNWRLAWPEISGVVAERDSPEARQWRSAVIARDNATCQRCGGTSELHAHHIERWATSPHLRLVVDNGETLCRQCHVEEHKRYG